MKAGRNDPCPCGSGRKYKQCCQHADIEREAGTSAGSTRRHVLQVAAQEPLWEVDAVPIPVGFDDGRKHRPVSVLVAAAELVISANLRDRLSGEPDALAEAIEKEIAAAAREVGCYPERLAVRHPELREPLQARLESRGVRVEVAVRLASEPAARSLIEHLSGTTQWPPASIADSWTAWRLPPTTIRELFAAAAECWRRAPWKIMDDEQAPMATFPSGRLWRVGVMGNAAVEFGISLYSDPDDLYAVASASDEREAMGGIEGRVLALTYNAVTELPPGMTVEARASGWEIAGPDAFPSLLTINTPGGGVTGKEIEELTELLRALPAFAEAHAEELVRERRTGMPSDLLIWESPAGLRLSYAGEGAMQGLLDEGASASDTGMDIDPEDALELRNIAQQVFEELGPEADYDRFVRLVSERSETLMERIISAPREAYGGLSPHQVGKLADAEWGNEDQAVVLNRSLPAEALVDALLLHQSRTLLAYVHERGGVPTTQSGYLATTAVRDLLPEFGGDPGKRLIETNVFPLHLTRILLELSDALVRSGRRFVVSAAGDRLLREGSEGQLFACLVTTCFQHFNLDYFGGPEWPELQYEIGYTLYRLAQRGADWSSAEELLPEVVLAPTVRAGPGSDSPVLAAALLELRILQPLVMFGLMELERVDDPRGRTAQRQYRATPLLRDFISFRI